MQRNTYTQDNKRRLKKRINCIIIPPIDDTKTSLVEREKNMPGIYSGNGPCKVEDKAGNICKGKFVHKFPKGLYCSKCGAKKTDSFRVVWNGVNKRFDSYNDALDFLIQIMGETKSGKFDVREYQKDQPLSIDSLTKRYIKIKENQVTKETLKLYENYIDNFIQFFGKDTNIKQISKIDLIEFQNFLSKNFKSKTIKNNITAIKTFFNFCYDSEVIDRVPVFPKISAYMAYRPTIDKATQIAMISEIKKTEKNTKIWLAIDMLATYLNMRKGELRNIKERDIDLKQGIITIPHPKEKIPKKVYLIPRHIEIIKSFPRGMPHMYFFRHEKDCGLAKAGDKYGPQLLNNHWNPVRKKFKVESSVYPGTRHSSAIALEEKYSPEQIRLATGHHTSKAFSRYFQNSPKHLREINAQTDPEAGKSFCNDDVSEG